MVWIWKYLEKLNIKIKNWKEEEDIKNELFSVIAQSRETEYKKVEDYFKNMPKDIKILLSLAKGCSDELKKKVQKKMLKKL